MHRPGQRLRRPRAAALLALVAVLASACDQGAAPSGPVVPGSSTQPREVNLITRDYAYVPSTLDLVPGETVLLHVVNAGLVVHEAVLGDMAAQLAWEAAEAPTVSAPPGPSPSVATPPGFEGVRVVVGSGQRMDVVWTVPADAASAESGWFVGCHIPGHWAKGMVAPVRFPGQAAPSGAPTPAP